MKNIIAVFGTTQKCKTDAFRQDTFFHVDLALILCLLTQYYDDTAGILRSVILSAVAPHRMSASPMPMPRQDSSAGPIVLPMASPLEEPIFTAFEDDVEDS